MKLLPASDLFGRLRSLRVPDWLRVLVAAGITSQDKYVRRRQTVVNVSALAGIADNVFHTASNSLYAFHDLLPINIYGLVMVGLFALTTRFHRLGENAAAIYFVLVVAAGNLFVVWSLGRESGTQAYFALGGAAFIYFGVGHWRQFAVVFVLAFVLLVTSYQFAPEIGAVMPDDIGFRHTLQAQVMINVLIISTVLIVYALTALHRAEAALEAEHERSETLLETIMPRAIADRLKAAPAQRIADRHEELTVLFVDLVGFTPAARTQSPDAVISYLDTLFRAFDREVEISGTEKIKTIGDAYMVVGGLGENPDQAAVSVGRLALAMLGVMAAADPLGGTTLQLRLGIHIGPAVAGVIGKRRYSYDVWGDAVNVASRMESHSIPGRIQVSEDFFRRTANAFQFEAREPIDVKGVGEMRTAFLLGLKSSG